MDITEQIIKDITSRDTQKVWYASCEIIHYGQNHDIISPLIEYLPKIKKLTKGLNMGGLIAPNRRFVDFAIKTIEFHRDSKDCACVLYTKGYELFNPKKEDEKGNIKIYETVMHDDRYIDFYLAKCLNCGRKFRIIEAEYHYTLWKWEI